MINYLQKMRSEFTGTAAPSKSARARSPIAVRPTVSSRPHFVAPATNPSVATDLIISSFGYTKTGFE